MIAAVDNNQSSRPAPPRFAIKVTTIATATEMMYSRVKIKGMTRAPEFTMIEGRNAYNSLRSEGEMKTKWTCGAQTIGIALICCASVAQLVAAGPPPTMQAGIPVPDRFRHAEQFIRTFEAGGLVVQSIGQSTMEASFGGGQNAAFITTDKGVVEVVVLPGSLDAEQ